MKLSWQSGVGYFPSGAGGGTVPFDTGNNLVVFRFENPFEPTFNFIDRKVKDSFIKQPCKQVLMMGQECT